MAGCRRAGKWMRQSRCRSLNTNRGPGALLTEKPGNMLTSLAVDNAQKLISEGDRAFCILFGQDGIVSQQ